MCTNTATQPALDRRRASPLLWAPTHPRPRNVKQRGWLASSFAGTSNTLIRVVGFGTDTTVTLDVGKGIVHETTVATLVAFGVAGDKHLFGKGHEFAGGDGVSTFGRTGGGKGPLWMLKKTQRNKEETV